MKLFDILIDLESEELGLECVSLVDSPAVEISFLKFNDERKRLKFANDEKHEITGVALLADVPIYRYSQKDGEYYIKFSKDTIRKMVFKYFKQNQTNSVNLEHDDNKYVDSVIMTESYFVDKERGLCPKEFEGVSDGSWIVTYKVLDEKLWDEVKKGTFHGFSIQGFFSFKKVTDDYKNKEQDWSWLDDYITD